MAAPIGPGDWVEYYRRGLYGPYGEARLRPIRLSIGSIYRVEEVWDGSLYPDGFGAISLVEVPGCYPSGARIRFCLSAFRPIYRPKSSIIESLKQPAPELEPA